MGRSGSQTHALTCGRCAAIYYVTYCILHRRIGIVLRALEDQVVSRVRIGYTLGHHWDSEVALWWVPVVASYCCVARGGHHEGRRAGGYRYTYAAGIAATIWSSRRNGMCRARRVCLLVLRSFKIYNTYTNQLRQFTYSTYTSIIFGVFGVLDVGALLVANGYIPGSTVVLYTMYALA